MRMRGWVAVAIAALSLTGAAVADDAASNVWIPGDRLVVFEEFANPA